MLFTLHRLLLVIVYLLGFVAISTVSKGSITVYGYTLCNGSTRSAPLRDSLISSFTSAHRFREVNKYTRHNSHWHGGELGKYRFSFLGKIRRRFIGCRIAMGKLFKEKQPCTLTFLMALYFCPIEPSFEACQISARRICERLEKKWLVIFFILGFYLINFSPCHSIDVTCT